MSKTIKVGCCGFSMAQKKYYKEFSAVEIQKTFYQPPMEKTARRWRDDAPDNFEFSIKAWQVVTHQPSSPTYRRMTKDIDNKKKKNYGSFKLTEEVINGWERTSRIGEVLDAEVIVFQCPKSFKPAKENIDNMNRFFSEIDRKNFKLAWEPRGEWDESVIKEICSKNNLIHSVDPFKNKPLAGDIEYFRLHGIGGYKYSYTDKDFKILKDMSKNKKESYIMFNNSNRIYDAKKFKKVV
ncbi:MAG: DUF72 domain-containing protein [Elusimicrobiota bacterium]